MWMQQTGTCNPNRVTLLNCNVEQGLRTLTRNNNSRNIYSNRRFLQGLHRICMAAGQFQNFTEEIEALTQKLSLDEITYFLPGQENFELLVLPLGPSKFEQAPLEEPQIVILPKDENQVAKILSLTKNLGLPIGVRNGGHGNQGLSTPPRGIVISMSNFKHIEIDEERQQISLGGGVNMQELNEVLNGTGYWLPLADGATVGYTGFLLHGGISHTYGKFTGLGSDLLLSATIVLSNGEIIETDKKNHADLFSVLNGAGSIFGVVTKLKLQLVNIENLSHDYFIYPYSEETLKKSIIFLKNISTQFDDVQVCVTFYNVGIENDFIEINVAYNTTENYKKHFILKQNILNCLKSIIQIDFLESGINLLPYERLDHNEKNIAPILGFLFNINSDFRYRWYSQGFKYNYFTKENIQKVINTYHKNQLIEENNQKILKGGYYNALGGKFDETNSFTGLKNPEIFSLIVDIYSRDQVDQFELDFQKVKEFGRNEDGIFADIYPNLDMFPIPKYFENQNQIFGDFIGGQKNLKKLKYLKQKYDPKNFFKGHYFQQVFQDEQENNY